MLQKIRPGVRLVCAVNPERQYYRRVLRAGPIACWPLWEQSGSYAQCLVNPIQKGTAVGVTWADALTPMGTPAPFFDGANDYVNILTAALATAWNGNTGGFGAWARVANAGVWTDGLDRMILRVTASTTEEAGIPKYSTNNQFRWRTKRNNVFVPTISAETSLDWELWSMSWDTGGFYLYRNGVSRGTPALAQPWTTTADAAMIGAIDTVPGWPWHGWIAYPMIFDYTVPQATWQDLATP